MQDYRRSHALGVTTTVYIGKTFGLSVSGGITSTVKYYYAGGSRIAMRQNGGAVKWLLGDHLGSASVMANSDGSLSSRQGYKAWGETRFGSLPTKYQYTGQMNEQSIGLYYYGARWYDASLGRFVQPDTVIPELDNPLAWDRYSYACNNPVRYSDPSGHWIDSLIDIASLAYDAYDISKNGLNWENGLSTVADLVSLALPVVAGGGLMVRTVTHFDDVTDAARAVDRIVPLSDEAIGFGSKLIENIGERIHHVSSYVNNSWTPFFRDIASKYGLKLDQSWNKIIVPQNSKHPAEYHKWILNALQKIDEIAKGDTKRFLELYNKHVVDVVGENPWILKKAWWEKYGDEFWEWWDESIKKGLE